MARFTIIFLSVAVAVSFAGAQEEGQRTISVLMKNGDHLTATGVTLQGDALTLSLPYTEMLEVQRSAVAGLTIEPGKGAEISEGSAEGDRLGTTKGEVLTGKILSIDGSGVRLAPAFAPDTSSSIPFERVSYCIFEHIRSEDKAAPDDGIVKIIFTNNDLMTGTMLGFSEGEFGFKPVWGKEFAFEPADYQAIHNAKTSKGLIEGGLAAAVMTLLKNAKSAQSYSHNVYIALVRAFIETKDLDGAVYVFENLGDTNVQPYMYRQLADEFYRNEMYELAIKAYDRILDSGQKYYYDYDKLITAHLKLGRKADAAEVCEDFLKQKELITRQGKNPIDLHIQAADLYVELNDFVKAAEHLQTVIVDPGSKKYKRDTAREKLIAIYKTRGQLDDLIARYRTQLDEKEKTIGEGVLLLMTRYIEQGKYTKARVEFDRLKQLDLGGYIAEAERIMSETETGD